MTRRHALLLAATPAYAQRLAPVEELVNTFEMEEQARRKLSPDLFALIAGSDRSAFDRITLRPRLMVDTTGLDLSLELFGQRHFAPILIGPTALQGRFHPGGESAMLEGAAAAKAAVVVASKTTEKLAPKAPFWMQIEPGGEARAIQLGARAIVITCNAGPFDWGAIDRAGKAKIPVILKGIMSPRDAQLAYQRGAQGIVVSHYRTPAVPGMASAIEALPAIAAEVGAKIPILIDGSFRRGSDVLKALALGAKAVLVGRPPLWGLSAYGPRGVQQVMEQLQTELARDMAMCGKVNLQQIGLDLVKIHRR